MRCPDEDTGRNSVKPSIMPRITAEKSSVIYMSYVVRVKGNNRGKIQYSRVSCKVLVSKLDYHVFPC
jgi:hypothetical protein